MKGKLIISLFLLCLLAVSCKKEKVASLVPGNQAPPDPTVSTLVTENFVNKVYISVLGRKPVTTEFDEGISILSKNNMDKQDISQFLDIVFEKPEYYRRTYSIASSNLIQNADSSDIQQFIDVFNFLLLDSSNQYFWPYYIIERDRLIELQQTIPEYSAGTIGIREVHRRLINNYFYDQINMGTENFVVSTFQHFLFRYPTQAELDNGKLMVDGFNAFLFLEDGNTKDEYMDIFLASSGYYEGQVRELFNRFLFRDPTTAESFQFTNSYRSDDDFKALQKEIISSDEFVGR